MKRYNPDLLAKIFKMCDDRGYTEIMTPEHYETFIAMDDDSCRIISKIIIRNLWPHIASSFRAGKFKSDGDLARYVTSYWEMMIQGFVIIHEPEMTLSFRKPRGVSVSGDVERRIDARLARVQPVILQAFREVLDEARE